MKKIVFSLCLALSLALLAGCSPPSGPIEVTGDVSEASGWKSKVVIKGLEHPWSMAWLPDGTMLITERPGRLRRVEQGRLLPSPIKGVPKVYAEGQGGLFEVSPHPDFAQNQLVYLTYAEGSSSANRTALARARLVDGALENLQVIFRVNDTKTGSQHFGSRIVWLPDKTLLLSTGDGGNTPKEIRGILSRKYAQNKKSHLGKILRLRDDGHAAADNPFSGDSAATPEIWTYGHRNTQGLVTDTFGRVWSTEHGSRGGDELNLIVKGGNYGWPEVTYSREYFGPSISDQTHRADVQDPKVVWTPSIAPSGLVYYTGAAFPSWRGNLFAGALAFQQIRRMELKGEKVVLQEKLTIGKRVRDVRQGPDGGLYVLTDMPKGELLLIVPK